MLLEHPIKNMLEISQLKTRRFQEMGFFLLLSLISVGFLSLCLFVYITYPVAMAQNLQSFYKGIFTVPWVTLLRWVGAGLVLSTLGTLLAWPFALATAVILEQEQGQWARYAQPFLVWLSNIPLIVYGYVFLQFLALDILKLFRGLWLDTFASVNWMTQFLAFASTIVLYPLLIFVPGSEDVTIDYFYQKALRMIIDFGEMGLTITLICIGLAFTVLPKMIFQIQKLLRKSDNLRSLEVVRSLGGTLWESMHISIINSMKARFNFVIVRCVRYTFFEGIVVLLLIHYLFGDAEVAESFFGYTFSLFVTLEFLKQQFQWEELLCFGGALLLLHLLFIRLEAFFLKEVRGE